jgi:hypothetical protein
VDPLCWYRGVVVIVRARLSGQSLIRPISIIFLFFPKLQLELQTMMRRTIGLGIWKLNRTLSARS